MHTELDKSSVNCMFFGFHDLTKRPISRSGFQLQHAYEYCGILCSYIIIQLLNDRQIVHNLKCETVNATAENMVIQTSKRVNNNTTEQKFSVNKQFFNNQQHQERLSISFERVIIQRVSV